MARVRVEWDEAAIKLAVESPHGPIASAMARLAAGAVLSMKFRAPVAAQDRPATRRWPARRSGTLRSSIRAFRQPDGSYIVGPTDKTASGELLGPMIEKGTRPHVIRSHGPWSLHNPVTGDYFGQVVHHPGTAPHPFIAAAAADLHGARVAIR